MVAKAKNRMTGIELSKLLPHSLRSLRPDQEDGISYLIPEFITARFAVYNFAAEYFIWTKMNQLRRGVKEVLIEELDKVLS